MKIPLMHDSEASFDTVGIRQIPLNSRGIH